jgi:alkylhydroperoxidase/carboxymuconolactone decarboxylase family protein YurZ
MPTKSPIELVLPDEAMVTLRAGYSRATLEALAVSHLVAPYPQGAELPRAILTHFFPVDGDALAARDRERVILALLLAQGADATQLAIHVYWGLMEGLAVAEIMESLLLAGYYAGIFRYQRAITIVQRTLGAMETQASMDASVGGVLAAISRGVQGL